MHLVLKRYVAVDMHPMILTLHCTQLTDDDIQPLCAKLSRFKILKTIDLVSRGI